MVARMRDSQHRAQESVSSNGQWSRHGTVSPTVSARSEAVHGSIRTGCQIAQLNDLPSPSSAMAPDVSKDARPANMNSDGIVVSDMT